MITTREELIVALREASEIEHGLMVQYLFAALTCKKSTDEGLTAAQAALVREWEGMILSIAVDEMGHLGTVCNLLSAIGAPPHFGRPNLPQRTGYYPFPFDLLPFGEEALYRFQLFELPRGAQPPDPPADRAIAADIALTGPVPRPLIYALVGELYERIREGFENIPEHILFIGPQSNQADNDWSIKLGIHKIEDRASAFRAIDDIIVDGEGTPEQRDSSHYARFTAIRDRLVKEGRFEAARKVIANPHIRAQRDADATAAGLITDEQTRQVAELFAGFYALVLRLLAQYFSYGGESPAQRETIRSCAARLMSVALRPISEVLTSLPAQPGSASRAGPTFELFNDVILAPSLPARWTLLIEHFDTLIEEAQLLAKVHPRLGHIGETVGYMRRTFDMAAKEQ